MIPGFVSTYLSIPVRNVSETALEITSSDVSAVGPPNGTDNDCSDADPPPEPDGDCEVAPRSVLPLDGHCDRSLQPQPFLYTGLGHLPPEIREDIWKLVCTASQEGLSTPQKIACPTILQVCRFMYQEAQPVYYTHTCFHFTGGFSLCSFLKKIGPERCKDISTLHLSGLVHQEPLYTEEELTGRFNMRSSFFVEQRESLSARSIARMNQENADCFSYLQLCKNLKVIILSLHVGQEYLYHWGLEVTFGWYSSVAIDVIDDFNWVVRKESESKSRRIQQEYINQVGP